MYLWALLWFGGCFRDLVLKWPRSNETKKSRKRENFSEQIENRSIKKSSDLRKVTRRILYTHKAY